MTEKVLAFKGTDRKTKEVYDFYTATHLNPSNRLNDGLYIKIFQDEYLLGTMYFSFEGTEIHNESFNISLTYENFISHKYNTRIRRFDETETFLEMVAELVEDILDVDTGLSPRKAQLAKVNEIKDKIKNL